jgi:hypothetical protein
VEPDILAHIPVFVVILHHASFRIGLGRGHEAIVFMIYQVDKWRFSRKGYSSSSSRSIIHCSSGSS